MKLAEHNAWPWCAVCFKPVDRVETDCERLARTFRFTAHCHGETEETVLTEEDVAAMTGIQAAVAFRDKVSPERAFAVARYACADARQKAQEIAADYRAEIEREGMELQGRTA